MSLNFCIFVCNKNTINKRILKMNENLKNALKNGNNDLKDIHQEILNIGYDRWQVAEHK